MFYDKRGFPLANLMDWGSLFREPEYQVVKQSRHKERGREFWLSTVWIGLAHSYGDPPLIFETMVFDIKPKAWNDVMGDLEGDEQMRWATEDEARKGHDPWEMTK